MMQLSYSIIALLKKLFKNCIIANHFLHSQISIIAQKNIKNCAYIRTYKNSNKTMIISFAFKKAKGVPERFEKLILTIT